MALGVARKDNLFMLLMLLLVKGALAMEETTDSSSLGMLSLQAAGALFPVAITIMSINCNGLRPKRGSGAGSGETLRRRRQLAAIVRQAAPTIVMLQETWLQEHDSHVQVDGYRSFSRPRLTPKGRPTVSGGIGILVSRTIPAGRIAVLPHMQEAGSYGTLFLEITVGDDSVITVGTIYSEGLQTARDRGLDMAAVWAARSRWICLQLLRRPGPFFLLGDFNAHLGDFQELPLEPRAPLGGSPSRSMAAHTAPFVDMLRDLPLAVVNGRFGPALPTCFQSRRQAARPDLHHGYESVLDLAVVRSDCLQSSVAGFQVLRPQHPFSDHRAILLHARLPAALELAMPREVRGVERRAARPLRLPGVVTEGISSDLSAATRWWASRWTRRHGSYLGTVRNVTQQEMDDAYQEFVGTLSTAFASVLDRPP